MPNQNTQLRKSRLKISRPSNNKKRPGYKDGKANGGISNPLRNRIYITVGLLASITMAGIGLAAQAATPSPQTTVVKMNVGGLARSYRLHIPPSAGPGKQLPLVLNLHGALSSALSQEQSTQMNTTADQKGFVVVYPEGTTGPIADQHYWNAGDCCGPPISNKVDDVAFLLAVINNVSTRTSINSHRVYVTGFSNGGMMAHRMAAMASTRIAAIASVAGPVDMAIHPSRAVPIMEIHSMDDPVAQWNGAYFLGYYIRPVMDGINQWVDKEHCQRPPVLDAPIVGIGASAGVTSTRIKYLNCAGGSVVVVWRFTGLSHVWPGGPYNLSPKTTTPLNTNNAIWQFLKGKSI